MCCKLSLIFVAVLAISFVHSLPNWSEVQTIKDIAHLHRMAILFGQINTEGRSKENSGKVAALIFSTLIGDDGDVDVSTDVETDPDYAFGPQFNGDQFMARLVVDMEKSLKRKCKKNSGSDETYGKVKAARKALATCLINWSRTENIPSGFSILESVDDYKSSINQICLKRDVPMKCLDTYMDSAQCSFPSKIESRNSIYRIVKNILNAVCVNDGNDMISMIFGQCLIENLNEIKTCSIKASYAIVKGFFVKMIEYETFDYRMDAERCKDFDEANSCYVSAVENCADPMPKNFISSIFQVVRNETECSKIGRF